jgi:hypothetical protein
MGNHTGSCEIGNFEILSACETRQNTSNVLKPSFSTSSAVSFVFRSASFISRNLSGRSEERLWMIRAVDGRISRLKDIAQLNVRGIYYGSFPRGVPLYSEGTPELRHIRQ